MTFVCSVFIKEVLACVLLCSWRFSCEYAFALTGFLSLDLKRFSEARVRTSKLSTFVNFPLKDLDLREFASGSSGEFYLRLYYLKKLQCLLMSFVTAPVFNMSPPLSLLSSPVDAVYNLYAVSNHSGTTMGGHYTAYCRNPTSGEWYTFNDSRYQPLSLRVPPYQISIGND